MFTHPFVGMCLIGAGLICGGVGLLFLMLTVAMAGIATPAICCWIGGLFQKRGKKELKKSRHSCSNRQTRSPKSAERSNRS